MKNKKKKETTLSVPINQDRLVKVETSLNDTDKTLFEKAEFNFNEGFVHLNSKKIDKVTENFSQAILNDFRYASKNQFYCVSNKSPDDYYEAIHYFTTALRYFEPYAIAYYYRGIAKNRLNHFQESIEDFTRVIELDPSNGDAFYNRGCAKFDLITKSAEFVTEDGQSAIEDFTKAIEIDPNYASAYYHRGLIKDVYLCDKNGSYDDYQKAIELDPEDEGVNYMLAMWDNKYNSGDPFWM